MSVFGIDYAWGNMTVAALKRAGAKFVVVYLSRDSGKNLSPGEAKMLSDAGIWIVVIWETTANRAMSGRSGGAADATEAARQAKACGMPSGRPIYFAVDWDATSSQQSAIHAYLDGAASVLTRARVGLYAGYGPIHRAFAAKKITFGWQTYAWSGGNWDAHTQLQQYSNGHYVGGVGCDYDRAMATDYGQWRIGVTPTPAPKPTPSPTPAPATLEDDMLHGNLKDGANAETPISFPRGAAKAIGFWGDTGKAGPGKDGKPQVVHLRVAVEHAKGSYDVSEVTVDSRNGKTVVPFTNPGFASCVGVTRIGGDASDDIPVAWDAS